MVFLSFRERVDLVTNEYYETDSVWDARYKQMNNAVADKQNITVNTSAQQVEFVFSGLKTDLKGTVSFYKPNNKDLDFSQDWNIATDSIFSLPTAQFQKGLWRARINYESPNRKYCKELSFVIAKP